jgi:hypothetical protein
MSWDGAYVPATARSKAAGAAVEASCHPSRQPTGVMLNALTAPARQRAREAACGNFEEQMFLF